MNFFTSDTHFGHRNVIEYCKRPFATAEDMDNEIIRRWNAVVGEHDQVYHLGDFAFCGKTRAREIMNHLTGSKFLIRGNHDHWTNAKYLDLGFSGVYQSTELAWNGWKLSHFPYRGQEADDRKFETQLEDTGGWLLCGHVHTAWKQKGRMINVGVDQWNFAPVSEQEISDLISAERTCRA